MASHGPILEGIEQVKAPGGAVLLDQSGAIPSFGARWYVSSVVGNNKLSGKSAAEAVATLVKAVALASAGDTIYFGPGHVETYSSAAACTIAKKGLKLLSLGLGSDRATFTFDTATTSTINITAANVAFYDCIFVANFAAVVAPFTLTTAKDFQLYRCEFRDTSAILNFVNLVSTDATSNDADGLRIEDCKRIGAGATANTTIVLMNGTNDRLFIRNNSFAHKAVTAAGLMIIAAGKLVTNAEIENNKCNFVQASNLATGLLITTNGSTNSGYIRKNLLQTLDDTTPILVTASSGFIFDDNKVASNADASGYLRPALDT